MAANGLTYEHGARYLVRPVRWGLTESKEKKTPQFYISAQILGQIDPQNPQGELIAAPAGERTAFWFLTENAVDNLIRDLADMGFQGTLADLDPTSPNAFDFAPLELTYNCQHEQYNGKWRERFQYGQGGSFNPLPLEQKQLQQLNAMFGKRFTKLAAPRGGNGAAPARPAQPAARQPRPAAGGVPVPTYAPGEAPGDSDIPF